MPLEKNFRKQSNIPTNKPNNVLLKSALLSTTNAEKASHYFPSKKKSLALRRGQLKTHPKCTYLKRARQYS